MVTEKRRPTAAVPRSARRAPPPAADLDAVFAALKSLLVRQARHLVVVLDAPNEYTLNTRKAGPSGTPMFFGSVVRRRSEVVFHLTPLEVDAALAGALSPALRRRLQGRSAFHFAAPEPHLFEELDRVTRAGMASFERKGLA